MFEYFRASFMMLSKLRSIGGAVAGVCSVLVVCARRCMF